MKQYFGWDRKTRSALTHSRSGTIEFTFSAQKLHWAERWSKLCIPLPTTAMSLVSDRNVKLFFKNTSIIDCAIKCPIVCSISISKELVKNIYNCTCIYRKYRWIPKLVLLIYIIFIYSFGFFLKVKMLVCNITPYNVILRPKNWVYVENNYMQFLARCAVTS